MSRYIDIEPYEKDGWYLQRRHRNSYGESIMTAPLVLVPTAEAEPVKHGRWKIILSGDYAICTNCEHYWIPNGDQYDYYYCPYCGARMDGGENE